MGLSWVMDHICGVSWGTTRSWCPSLGYWHEPNTDRNYRTPHLEHTHRHDEKSAFLHQFLPSWTGSCLGQLPEELRRESSSTVFLAPGLAGQGPWRPELVSVFQRLHVEECSPPLPCKPGLDWAPKVPMEKRG